MVLKMLTSAKRRKVTQFPVMEEIDLKVTVQEIPLTKDFLFVKRVIFNIQWAAVKELFSTFGVDAALTNGIQIKYAGHLLFPHGIRNNAEFGEYMYDLLVVTDETPVTALNSLVARFSFDRITKNGEGLRINPDRKFYLVVQDDLSGSANTHLVANVQGWRYI